MPVPSLVVMSNQMFRLSADHWPRMAREPVGVKRLAAPVARSWTHNAGLSFDAALPIATFVPSGDRDTPSWSLFGPTVPSVLPLRSNHVSCDSRERPLT